LVPIAERVWVTRTKRSSCGAASALALAPDLRPLGLPVLDGAELA
jgi:hypothetical protein